MSKDTITKAIILLLTCLQLESCMEKELSPALDGNSDCRYVPVGLSIHQDGEGSKSVVSSAVEEFHGAVLYALNPATGEILRYGNNAGELSGSPVWISTQSKYFSWPLPEKTAMDIYCIVNPPEGFEDQTSTESITADVLGGKYFSCEGHVGLKALESSGLGLPLAGKITVGAGEITTDDAYLSITVGHLFAKYSFSLDLSGLEPGEKVTVNKLAVNNGNTRVPYFAEGFRQNDVSYLADSDYAYSSQLAQLSKGGGASNSVDIYVLENCHGTHEGVNSWWTVYKDLNQVWPEISKCTFIQLSYSITGKNGDISSYLSRIYLGSGDMIGDFDVRRNLYKNICIRIGRRTGDTDPFFNFGEDRYYMGPGTVKTITYDSNIYPVTSGNASPEVWITDSSGVITGDITVIRNDSSSGQADIRAGINCTPGKEYWLNGGCNASFFWPPYGSGASAFIQRRKLTIVESRTLTFDPPASDIYPYQYAEYLSRERFSPEIAAQMAESLEIKEISGNVDHRFTSVNITEVDGEYAVTVALVPDRPGTISFRAEYGEAGNTTEGNPVTVLEPVLVAMSETAPQDSYHVDALGNPIAIRWKLMTQDYLQLDNPVAGGDFSISKEDPYASGLTPSVQGYGNGLFSKTIVDTRVRVESFDGLIGLDEDNYTFSGITLKAKGTFTYQSGFSVSKTVSVTIDDPLSDYSYDGQTYEYALRQGWTAQSGYVSVSQPDYKLEYMLQWPQREFTVDLTRSGTRECHGLEVWTDHSGVSSLDGFAPGSGLISGIPEDLHQWGPVYYGRRLTNLVSGEKKTFVHSIIRLYCHYNVFAAIDAQEKNRVRVDWDNLADVNWSPTLMILNYEFGCFTACLKANFDKGGYVEELMSVIQKNITTDTRVKPVLPGFVLDTGGNKPAHGTYSAGFHTNYQCYAYDVRSYMMGYWNRPSAPDRYNIYYDWVYYDGVDDNADMISWRVIAVHNQPWFKAGPGGYSINGNYITPVQKNSDGEYCFNVIPSGASPSDYADSEGYGYQRISLFWEGREGKTIINSKDLHPLTSFNADLCLVNGWYDPSLYTDGLPVPANKVGMYFFPEYESVNTRDGFPAYYENDWPYALEGHPHGSMEIGLFSHLEFGDLAARDRNAAR